ncbi:hypothetical protein Tco_0858144 [Tanacetum coccineum]|uniref:Uncharacterized protein n=1 Tax=Tanacetum coccineum TaxID=301880 RepID=A0ABQ5BAG8_9ASTR
MKIPNWMISEEIKHTEHYRMYAEVFRIDVPLTQSQPTDSTQGMHRTPSAPRRSTRLTLPAPVPTIDKADEMILQDILQVTLAEHKSREEQEARENVELVNKHLASVEIEKMVEGPENVIDDSSITRNDDQNILGTRLEPRSDKESLEVEITNNEEVEITNVVIHVNVNEEEEEITDEVYELKRREKRKIVEESKNTPFPTPIRSPRIHIDLISSDTEKLQELTVTDTTPTPSSSSLNTKLSTTNRLLLLFKSKHARFKRYKRFFQELQGGYGYLFEHLRAKFLSRKSFDTLADHLQEVMVESLPTMVDKHIKEQVEKQVPEQVKVQVPVYVAKGLILERQQNKEETDKMIAKAMLQEHGKLQAEISSQIQQAIDINIPSLVDASVRSYMSGHILHVHPAQPQTSSVPEQQYQLYLSMKADPQLQQQDIAIWLALQMKFETFQVPQTTCRTSAVRPRDQDDPHDDAHPEGENSAKRQKTSEYEAYVTGESSGQVNEKEQGQSFSRNQEQTDDYDFWTESYASDDDEVPMKQVSQDIMEEVSLTINEAELNFFANEIKKEILPHPRKTTPLVQSCQRDPEAPTLSLINQDLLYLKKGNPGPEKIVLSLHKFPTIIFNDVDIEERTSRKVNKCVKKFNPYSRYGVEHWKNPHANIFYIKRQKEPGKPKEVVYLNLKINQVIKTYWELGFEHKFITKIVARRANECIVSITESDYKNLNKNDIEDMYLLIMNGKVPDYAETVPTARKWDICDDQGKPGYGIVGSFETPDSIPVNTRDMLMIKDRRSAAKTKDKEERQRISRAEALSPVRADLIPSPKRVKDSGYLTDVEVDPREISLRDDAIVRVSDEPHLEQDIDPEIQAEIDECIAYADALRDRGIDARVVVEAIDRDETETGVRGPVEVRVERVTHPVMPEDIPEPAQEGAVEVTYETLGDLVQRFHDHTQAIPVHRIQAIEGVQREQGHRMVGVESAVIALTERIAELERDNMRLRGTMSVESQRVDRLQRGMSRMQRELRQMRRLRFYDRVRVGRLEACARKHMGYRS